MDIIEARERTPALIENLVSVWERSVRATHLFLSPCEIAEIKKYVPQALQSVPHLLVAEEEQRPVGFLGADGQTLAMLFLAPEARGRGLGRRLLCDGIDRYALCEVTVNEQNPQAIGFYERMGFHRIGRSELDEQGQPYPILYLRKN